MTREYAVPRGFEDGALGHLRPVYDRAVWRGGGGAMSRQATQAQLARVVRGAPEVVVKTSGRIYAASNFRRHLGYISRNGALALEGPNGELVETPKQVDDLAELDIGIQAMAAIPVGAADEGIGESDIRVNFGGVTFFSGDHLYADNTGIILSEEPLDIE